MLEPDRWAWRPQKGSAGGAGGPASKFRRTDNLYARSGDRSATRRAPGSIISRPAPRRSIRHNRLRRGGATAAANGGVRDSSRSSPRKRGSRFLDSHLRGNERRVWIARRLVTPWRGAPRLRCAPARRTRAGRPRRAPRCLRGSPAWTDWQSKAATGSCRRSCAWTNPAQD